MGWILWNYREKGSYLQRREQQWLVLCPDNSQSYLFKNPIRSHYSPAPRSLRLPNTMRNEPQVLTVPRGILHGLAPGHLSPSPGALALPSVITQTSVPSLQPASFLSEGFYAVCLPQASLHSVSAQMSAKIYPPPPLVTHCLLTLPYLITFITTWNYIYT